MKILFFCALITLLKIPPAISFSGVPQSVPIQEKIMNLSDAVKGTKISKDMLPVPYDYLLTQPLMTHGIEKYYQRTPFMAAQIPLLKQIIIDGLPMLLRFCQGV